MSAPLSPNGEPLPLTPVQPFKPGFGRPDLDALHQAVHMLDAGITVYEVREFIATYINARTERTLQEETS